MLKKTIVYRFLRCVYWWYIGEKESWRERKRLRILRRRLMRPLGKKVYIIGTPTHENLGDSAIVLAQKAFLERCGWEPKRIIEITYDEYLRDWIHIRRWIPKSALIAQLGGGHMGNQWFNEELLHRQQVLDLPDNAAVIFPQTLFYTADEQGKTEEAASVSVYNGKDKLVVAAREKRTFDQMRRLYPETRILLIPDIVLSANMALFGARKQIRNGVILCFRNDSEQALKNEERDYICEAIRTRNISYHLSDMYSEGLIEPEERKQLVRKKMEEIASVQLVITDRLHGMVFCALTGTPCIALGNNNYKVQGTYDWISYLPYIRFAKSVADIESHVLELLEKNDWQYDNEPLMPYFEKLAEVVRKECYGKCDRTGL